MSVPLKLTPGVVFANDYKVVRPLSTGGQGSIYVVEQLSTSKLRALKLMLPELVAQPASRKRFELEAKIAARIQSDHVVESIASGVDAESGTPWLAMELLEGQDLAEYIHTKKRLPPAEVLEIFSQLCHALGAAHEQGIVHRDLKPENIFLAAPRRRGVPFMVKVLDFGIARIVAEVQTQSGATTSGLGTPMWMAPEQAVPGAPVGPQTDVWPLGLIAFRLLTGYLFWKAPYDQGASVMMLMAEAFMHPLPTASERADHYKRKDRLPAGFDDWFAKCVTRQLDQRWANAAEAFAALEPLLAKIGSEASLPERPSVLTPAPIARADARTLEAPASSGEDERAPSDPDAPQDPTGPGLKTWEGAPELAAEAVLSVPISTPPPAPPAVAPPQETPAGSPAPAKDAAKPAARGKEREIVAVAATFGVLLGLGIVALQRIHRAEAPVSAVQAAPSAPAAPLAPKTAEPAPTPPAEGASADPPPAGVAADEGAADPPPEASANGAQATGFGRRHKVCKPEGAKCFSNDDCCDRACHHWICKANAVMHDPYGAQGD